MPPDFSSDTKLRTSILTSYDAASLNTTPSINASRDFFAMGRWDQTGASYPADKTHTWTDGWPIGCLVATQYNHVAPPNWAAIDCSLTGDRVSDTPTEHAIVTARSSHPGVVNAVFGDGHSSTITQGIDVWVWRALGTRNGQDNNFMKNSSEANITY